MKKRVENLIESWKEYNLNLDKKVLEAFRKVKRELFVPHYLKEQAYIDYPLPIGYNQTISQPFTVAIMTNALKLKKGQKVLEVGAGSGYQAAIISKIIGEKGKVITTEIISQLAELARSNLRKAKIRNVIALNKDGSKGYKKESPYDRIIVTAAAPKVPKDLLEQLKPEGILIAPIGSAYHQEMLRIIKPKQKQGKLKIERVSEFEFVFVPLTA